MHRFVDRPIVVIVPVEEQNSIVMEINMNNWNMKHPLNPKAI